jgi:hypothetical protein
MRVFKFRVEINSGKKMINVIKGNGKGKKLKKEENINEVKWGKKKEKKEVKEKMREEKEKMN